MNLRIRLRFVKLWRFYLVYSGELLLVFLTVFFRKKTHNAIVKNIIVHFERFFKRRFFWDLDAAARNINDVKITI